MLNIIRLAGLNDIMVKNHEIIMENKEELMQSLLMINIKREILLSFILLAIDIFLLVLNMISTKVWSRDIHIFGYFSYMHIILVILPSIFLLFVFCGKSKLMSNVNLYRVIHWILNSLVLSICAFISVSNEKIGKFSYPYIIALFCIASIVLLGKKERFTMYIFSYMIYLIGCIIIKPDIYNLIGDIFFSTLLVTLAMVVSHINYISYINEFVNHKIILNKNRELDMLYKASEASLKQRTRELNETVEYEKLRSAFFANISHELRTPLTVIFSAVQMVDLVAEDKYEQDMNKDIKQYMRVIRQNCYRLIRLIANFIDITKIDAGYLHVALKNCDIIKVVEDITLSVAKFIEDREISLIFDTDIEEMTIACDPDKIERIILNLLSNAVKFTPKAGRINVNIFDKNSSIEIRVKDNGIGIPKCMEQSVFERFIQVDKTISRNHEGSGIGLSLVKSLVNMHHGSISLVSEEGKGSEFIIELPKRIMPYEETIDKSNFEGEKQNVEKIHIEFSDIYR
jgi:two-component system, OmpR family, phosphate regulon sensor histidine kinase PhoR